MNISKSEQRILHALAQGGCIRYDRAANGKITRADCVTHDGSILSGCTVEMTSRLRRRRWIVSRESAPYRISPAGLRAVRAQLDNRV
ncbi:YjhX family toxin [Pseudooceanicola sp. LIPI14-2-Ac024]|uniref:YjhX family toxin n=1 Tax=Pseudooceanicola sp. LIPI14-2-Ac024 TaxID=3344875 RepID=UPI0035CFFDCB